MKCVDKDKKLRRRLNGGQNVSASYGQSNQISALNTHQENSNYHKYRYPFTWVYPKDDIKEKRGKLK